MKAVKEGRVYLIARAPYNWFDRPPSFMRFMGLRWLMSCLYPAEQKTDIATEVREFYESSRGGPFERGDQERYAPVAPVLDFLNPVVPG